MQVARRGVAGTDGGVEGGEQRRERPEGADERARRNVEPLVCQCGDHTLERAAKHVLLGDEAGQEPRGEQALRDRLCRDGGHEHAPHPAMTGPPVGRAATDDPHDAHLPVDLLGAFLAERHVSCAAVRTDPLVFRHVVDLFDGLETRVVPSTMSGAAGLLTPAAPLGSLGVVGAVRLGRGRLLLLRRGAEGQLGKRRHLRAQRSHLSPQGRVLGGQPLGFDPPALGLRPPAFSLVRMPGCHHHQYTRKRALCPAPSRIRACR